MSPFNDFVFNENIKRQIFLKRHRNGLSARLQAALREHDLEYAERFASSFLRLSARDLNRLRTSTRFETDRLSDFKDVLLSLQVSSEKFLNDFINPELDQLTIDEFDFQFNTVIEARKRTKQKIGSVNRVNQSELKEYRSLELMNDTTQEDIINKWSRGRVEKLLAKVRRGLREGKSEKDILKSVRGTDKRFSGILKDTHRGAIVYTNTLHVSATSAANFAFVDSNNKFDLLVSAALESGSSKVCMSNNNKLVFQDLNGFRSPYHINCNTRVFPFLKGDKPPSVNSTLVWWKNLNDVEKQTVLGVTRFEEYRKKPSSFKFPQDFISPDGDFLTLDQLKSKGVLKSQ